MRVDLVTSGRTAGLVAFAIKRLGLPVLLTLQASCAAAASHLDDRPSIARAEDVGNRATPPAATWSPDKATDSEHCKGCRDRAPIAMAKHADLADRTTPYRRGEMDAEADELLMLAGAVSFTAVVVVLLTGFFAHRERVRSRARLAQQDTKGMQKS